MSLVKNKPVVCGIVAIGPYNVIGCDGGMPWHSRQDFYHFKHMTMSYPCIFGRNTYEFLPKKPLPGRLNIVCSSKFNNLYKDGVFYAGSLERAIRECKGFKQLFICGGSRVYEYALEKNLIDIMYITEISEKDLEKQVEQKPLAYDYFPVDIQDYFNAKEWKKELYVYPNGILPIEENPVFCKFIKYVRTK